MQVGSWLVRKISKCLFLADIWNSIHKVTRLGLEPHHFFDRELAKRVLQITKLIIVIIIIISIIIEFNGFSWYQFRRTEINKFAVTSILNSLNLFFWKHLNKYNLKWCPTFWPKWAVAGRLIELHPIFVTDTGWTNVEKFRKLSLYLFKL